MAKFDELVAKFAEQATHDLAEVWHGSLRGLDQEMADNVTVVTGNLKNSRTVSTTGPVAVDWRTKKFRDPSDSINNAIAGAEPGGVAHLGFRAPYGHKVEARTGFLRLVAQRWVQIVAEAVARVGQ
jgi:hypothetical protein